MSSIQASAERAGPAKSLAELNQDAIDLWQKGDLEGACAAYRQLSKDHPEQEALQTNFRQVQIQYKYEKLKEANAYRSEGNPTKAVLAYQMIDLDEPANDELRFHVGLGLGVAQMGE